jgi:hypothetical protein
MEFMDLGDTAPNDRFAYLYSAGEEAAAATPVTYTLLDADGSILPLRDETTPLPGTESTPPPETETGTEKETETESTSEPITESGLASDTDGEQVTVPAPTDTDGTPLTVRKQYSMTLKMTILLTGAVLGVCAFLLIPALWKKRR